MVSTFTPTFVLPGWPEIFGALTRLRLEDIVVTLMRVVVGLILSFGVGFGLAVAAYYLPIVRQYLMPLVRLVMAVPATAWIVFSIMWFPGVEVRILFVLGIVSAPIFMIDILDGIYNIPRDLHEMVRAFRPSRLHHFSKLVFPGALPAIFTSWKVNLSLAIRVATLAELVGAVSGMGFAFSRAISLFRMQEVFALTLVLVVELMMLQGFVILLERRKLRWREV